MLVDTIRQMASLYTGSSKVKVFDSIQADDDGVQVKLGKKTSKVANMVKLSMTSGWFIIEYTNDDLYAKLKVAHQLNLKANEKFSVVIPFAKLIKACQLSDKDNDIVFRDTKSKLVVKINNSTDKVSKSDEFFIHYDINVEPEKLCETTASELMKCLILHTCGGNRVSMTKGRQEITKPVLDNVAIFHNDDGIVGATSISDGGTAMGKYKTENEDFEPLLIPLSYCDPLIKFMSSFDEDQYVSIYRMGGRIGIQGENFQLVVPQGSGQFPKLESLVDKPYQDIFIDIKRSILIRHLNHLLTAFDNESYILAHTSIVSHKGVNNMALSAVGELSETVIVTDHPKLTENNYIITISLPIFIKLLGSIKGTQITMSTEIVNGTGIMSKIVCGDHTYYLAGLRGKNPDKNIEIVLQQENDDYDDDRDDVTDEQPVHTATEPEQPRSNTGLPSRTELADDEIPF